MKKIFTLFLVLITTTTLWAYDFKVGDLCYNITSNTKPYTVEVTDAASSITTATIPETVTYNGTTYSVTSIGLQAFRGCSSLTSITIPESVTSIGDEAFWNCISLTSITIPESVTSIGNDAFSYCSSLTTITIPNSVTSIGDDAFYGCSSLTKTNYTGDIAGWCDIKFGSDDANPIYYSHNFYINDVEIKDLVIPNTVNSIHDYAFYRCSSLTSVTIPESVKSIGEYAFQDCSRLISVTLNSNDIVSENYFMIGTIASIFGSQVEKYVIGDNVTSIGDYAFSFISSRSKLTSVIIGNSVTNIGNFAFQGCSSLTSVTIGESVTSIGDDAFSHCSALTSVNIPNSVTSIGNHAFRGCSALKSIVWNARNCADPSFSSMAPFYGITSQIKSFILGENVENVPAYLCYGMEKLTSITIPNSVTSIGRSAFEGCSSLTKTNYTGDIAGWCNIMFGDNYANPMYYSHNFFINDQEIKDLVIPNSVTSIGDRAFSGCSSLTSITCEAENPPTVYDYAFYNVSTSIPVYVPCGCVGAYEAANRWNEFTNIQEPQAEYSIQVSTFDSQMGTAKVDYNTFCGNQISVTTNIGYHFVRWSDGNTDNPRSLVLTQDTTLTAEFAINTYTLTTKSNGNGNVTGNGTYKHGENVIISAIADIGYHFVRWSDGVTDNPRTVVLTQDTAFSAEFAQSFAGQCGDNLYWAYNESDQSIAITGTGDMYNYTSGTQPWILFQEKIKKVTTDNTAASLGVSAFEGAIRLAEVHIGAKIDMIEANVFAGCDRLRNIYCYPTYPPIIRESSFARYDALLYIPCDYLDDYVFDNNWKRFENIQCAGAEKEEIESDGVDVDPSSTSVTMTWPTEENANTYTIEIMKDGALFCRLVFNTAGQLLNISFAPSRDGNNRPAQYAELVANGSGLRFTVTGLNERTHYTYDLRAKDKDENTIQSHSGEFTTKSNVTTDMDNIQSPVTTCQKVMRNGQLIIIRDGVEYNAMGQEIH